MKNVVLFMTLTGLSMSALAGASKYSLTPEQVAQVFADGVYASMNREMLKKNPNAKISVWVDEANGSRPGAEVFKAILDVDGRVRCGTSVYFNDGQPTLEADIECDVIKGQSSFSADPAVADGELPIKVNIQANSRIVIKAQEGDSKLIASKIYTCGQPRVDAVAGTAGVQLFELDPGTDSPILTDANGNSWIVHCAENTNAAPVPPPPKILK